MTALSVLLICMGYLAGSIIGALLIGQLMPLPDPREFGSGNPGATNMLRTGGKWPALFTLLFDVAKGAVPVIIALVLQQPDFVVNAVATAAIVGHMFPLFYGFKGGKGVATALGVLMPLSMTVASGLVGIWILTFGIFRYSSLASITGAISTPVLGYLYSPTFLPAILVISVLIMLRHKSNIQNLLAGTEPRFDIKKEE